MGGEVGAREHLGAARILPLAPHQRFRQRAGQRRAVVGIDHRAERALAQRIEAAVAVSPDHRQTARRRLEEDDAEALLGARHHEHVGEPVVIGELRVRHAAGEADARLEAELAHETFQIGQVVTAPTIR